MLGYFIEAGMVATFTFTFKKDSRYGGEGENNQNRKHKEKKKSQEILPRKLVYFPVFYFTCILLKKGWDSIDTVSPKWKIVVFFSNDNVTYVLTAPGILFIATFYSC